jgi:hypothetical protein
MYSSLFIDLWKQTVSMAPLWELAACGDGRSNKSMGSPLSNPMHVRAMFFILFPTIYDYYVLYFYVLYY